MINSFNCKLLILLSCVSLNSFAQKGKGNITGKVSSGKEAKELASVSLVSATDTNVLKMVLTGNSGQFELKDVQFGKYRLAVSAIGFERSTTKIFELSPAQPNYSLDNIDLKTAPKALQNVTVSSKKQMIEQTLDKTLINVDASPTNAGLTDLEVLEKSPGVSVDKDGNISLKGKQGVMIMLDGKPTYLSAGDLANLLKNMPASQLEQIEIMTNPPAKYDAAGNSGIINIKTKKAKTQGFNGSINIGAGYSFNTKTNNSVALNYRTGKFNLFTNYSYNWNKGRQTLNLKRVFP
ncbi:MAG: TonB-dependent receptor, partial [Chitinophagaceae bacterium]|nr:TonB-dependent receptor [Chitinophagaceae bacterium]